MPHRNTPHNKKKEQLERKITEFEFAKLKSNGFEDKKI